MRISFIILIDHAINQLKINRNLLNILKINTLIFLS